MDQKQLWVAVDKLQIDHVVKSFFRVFLNKDDSKPEWSQLESLCIPEVAIINKNDSGHTIYNLQSFIEPRKRVLSDGTLSEFEEHETNEETIIFDHIAQRHSRYEKSGIMEGKKFHLSGNKLFQLVKIDDVWKISAVVWQDDHSGQ